MSKEMSDKLKAIDDALATPGGKAMKRNELAERYDTARRRLTETIRELNTSDSRWSHGYFPADREEVSNLQKMAHRMITEKRELLDLLVYAYEEYIEVVDDRGFEAHVEKQLADYEARLIRRTAG